MTHQIDSQMFYKTVASAIAQVEEAIQKSGCDKPIGIAVFAGSRYGRKETIDIQLTIGNYNDEVKVSGQDLWACVDELLRRLNFDQTQKNLQLGAPIIDQE